MDPENVKLTDGLFFLLAKRLEMKDEEEQLTMLLCTLSAIMEMMVELPSESITLCDAKDLSHLPSSDVLLLLLWLEVLYFTYLEDERVASDCL